MAQTEIQKNSAIRAGSLKVELGTSLGSLVDIGALRDLALEGQDETVTLTFDNVKDIEKYKNGNIAQLTGNLCEINLTNVALMSGGQIETTTQAATPVVGASEVVAIGAWSLDTAHELANQNGDGTVPTVTTVTGSVDGALSAGTDYTLAKVGNAWAIVVTGATTSAQTLTIVSTYTPAAAKVTTFNATGIKAGVYMRLTNTDENGKTLTVTMKDVINTSPMTMNFAGDTEDNVAEMPITLKGEIIEIVDEQQTV